MKKFLELCYKTIELLWWPWATLGGFTFLIGGSIFVNPIMYNFSTIFGTELSRFWSNVIATSIFIMTYILSHIIALLFLVAIVAFVKFVKRKKWLLIILAERSVINMTRKGFIIFIILIVAVTMLLSISVLLYAKSCALREMEVIQTYDLKLKEDFINVYALKDYTIQPAENDGLVVILKRGNVTAIYNYDNNFNFVNSNIDAYITSSDSIIIISSVIFCMVLGICIPFTYIGLKYARFKDSPKSSD